MLTLTTGLVSVNRDSTHGYSYLNSDGIIKLFYYEESGFEE